MEARLKFKVCEALKLERLPMVLKTHDILALVIFAGLLDELNALPKVFRSDDMAAKCWGDPDITVDFFASEFETHIEVVLGSPKFQNMGWSECHDSIWDYLRRDDEVTKEDLFLVSYIKEVSEAVEFI